MNKMKHIYTIAILATAMIAFSIDSIAQVRKLSLKEAVETARVNNPELKASGLEIKKSMQQRVIARSLFLPTVAATAAINHYFQLPPFFGFGDNGTDGKIPYSRFGGNDQLAFGVSAVQPLYNPGAFPAMQRARLLERESTLGLSSKQIQILSSIKQSYYQQLVLDERIQLQQESIGRNRRVLTDAKALFIQGKGLRVDTLRAYTAVRGLEPELLRLQYASETGRLQLKTLLGIDSLQDIELTDSLYLPDPATIPEDAAVYDAAKQNNPEVLLTALQQELAAQQIRQANASRLPVVSAVGLYQAQSQTNSFDYGNAHYPSSSYVGLQVSVPLFTGFSNQAKSAQGHLSKEQADLRLKYTNEQLRAAVHQAIANGHESMSRLRTTITIKETAKLSYDIIQYRYQKGIASRLELTDSELALTSAQSAYLEAIYDYLSARIALERIMGTVE